MVVNVVPPCSLRSTFLSSLDKIFGVILIPMLVLCCWVTGCVDAVDVDDGTGVSRWAAPPPAAAARILCTSSGES